MQEEIKTLQHKKQYVSNCNLRISTAQDQIQPVSNHLNSQLSYNITNYQSIYQKLLTQDFVLGDADTLFLTRQNSRLEEEILETIQEMEGNADRSVHLQLVCRLENQLQLQRKLNCKQNMLVNRLAGTSAKLVSLIRQKCNLVISLAKFIKELELSMQSMKNTLELTRQSMGGLESRYAILESYLKFKEQISKNGIDIEIQTQQLKFNKFEAQVPEIPLSLTQFSSQTQMVHNYQQYTQASNTDHFNPIHSQIGLQTDFWTVKEWKRSQKLSIQITQSINIEPKIKSLMKQPTKTFIESQQKYIEADQSKRSESLNIMNMEKITIEPENASLLNQFTQIQIPTFKVSTKSKEITTQIALEEQAVTESKQNKAELPPNMLKDQSILNRQEEHIETKKLSKTNQFSFALTEHGQQIYQTKVTEQLNIKFVQKQSAQNLLEYFKQISSPQKQISYNQQIIEDLQKNGQNQPAKALARLLKEHRYLKICLTRMIEKEHEQEQINNQKTMHVVGKSLKSFEKSYKGEKPAEQCRIY